MKKKGFTLIELLATIVILAIIALIAVPTINKILESVQKSSFKQNATGLLKVVQLNREDNNLIGNGIESTYEIKDNDIYYNNEALTTSYSGNITGTGKIYVNTDGEMAMYYSDGKYCAFKSYNNTSVMVEKGLCEDIGAITCSASDVTVTLTPSDSVWSQKKKVSITYNSDKCPEVYYKIGSSGSYSSYNDEFDITSESTLYVKRVSVVKKEDVQEIAVQKIDTTNPTDSNLSYTTELGYIIARVDNATAPSGIGGYEFALKTNDVWGGWTEMQSENVYRFPISEPGTYAIKARVTSNSNINQTYDKNTEMGVTTLGEMSATPILCDRPTISITPNGISQGKIVNIDYGSTTGCTGSYIVVDENSQTIASGTDSTFLVTTNNATIVARNSGGPSPVQAQTDITTIDRTAPTNANLSLVKNLGTITAIASATEDTSIAGYQFAIKQGNGEWSEWSAYQTSNQKEYTGLSAGEYTVKVKIYNTAYKNTESLNNSSLIPDANIGIVETSQIIELVSCPTPTFTITNGNTWEQSKTVTINYGNTAGCTGTYKTVLNNVESAEQSGSSVTVTTAGTVIVAYNSGGVTAVSNQTQIDTIDITAPTITSHTPSSSNNIITIDTVMSDSESGFAGVTQNCTYRTTSSGNYTNTCTTSTSTQSTITPTVTGTTYYYKICPIDAAGNTDAANCVEGSIEASSPTAANITYTNANHPLISNAQEAIDDLYEKFN